MQKYAKKTEIQNNYSFFFKLFPCERSFLFPTVLVSLLLPFFSVHNKYLVPSTLHRMTAVRWAG